MSYRSTLLAAAAASVFALACPTMATASTVTLNAILNGGNECVGGPPTCLQGDPDGYGVATISMPTGAIICFSIHVDNIDPPTAAHIHGGSATFNGAVIVPLAPPATGNPGTSSGCVASPAGFNKALTLSPADYYVNVHTGAFPNGALRGQVF